MAEFTDFQAVVDTTDSEIEEDLNNDRDDVTSLIDDSFEDDSNPLFYYRLHNVSRDTEEAISAFLNHENETVSREISNYYQESSSDKEDRTDGFVYSKNKVDAFKETLLNPKNPTEDS